MEIIKALEELKGLIERPRQFLGLTFGLNKDECVLLIRKIHAGLPEAVKQAEQITKEGERILHSAQQEAQLTLNRAQAESGRLMEASEREAARTLEQARAERERLVSESEVLRAAKAEAERLKAEAEAEATNLRRQADEYALDILTRIEGVISKALMSVERGKQEIARSSDSSRAGSPK